MKCVPTFLNKSIRIDYSITKNIIVPTKKAGDGSTLLNCGKTDGIISMYCPPGQSPIIISDYATSSFAYAEMQIK